MAALRTRTSKRIRQIWTIQSNPVRLGVLSKGGEHHFTLISLAQSSLSGEAEPMSRMSRYREEEHRFTLIWLASKESPVVFQYLSARVEGSNRLVYCVIFFSYTICSLPCLASPRSFSSFETSIGSLSVVSDECKENVVGTCREDSLARAEKICCWHVQRTFVIGTCSRSVIRHFRLLAGRHCACSFCLLTR